jgi:hypothetical protein
MMAAKGTKTAGDTRDEIVHTAHSALPPKKLPGVFTLICGNGTIDGQDNAIGNPPNPASKDKPCGLEDRVFK